MKAATIGKIRGLGIHKREDTKKIKNLYPIAPLFFVTSRTENNIPLKDMEKEDIVFSRNTVEFVTVAAEFCAYIERTNEHSRKEFVETLLKLLPLLYIRH